MAYRDRIQTASFRNVEFFIDSHTFEGGRRLVLHEFPNRDEPFSEDMGRKGRTFSIEGHIIGEDYFGARNRLIRAFEREGQGVLIHPYLGRKDVKVSGFSLNESVYEGAIVRFSVSFVEAGRNINPIGIFGEIFRVFDQINDTIDSLRSEFENIYSLTQLPGYVAESAIGVLNNATDSFTEALGIVPATTSAISGIKNDILDFGNAIPGIITQPAEIFTETIGLERSLSTITNDAADKQKILNEFVAFGDDADDQIFDTPSREQEDRNNKSIYRIIQGAAVCDIVGWFVQSVTEPFDITNEEMNSLENNTIKSIGDLETRRDEVVSIIDGFVEKWDEFESRDSFLDLKALMLNALPQDETNQDLRKEINFTTLSTLPSLAIVYERLESLESHDDFIERNRIRSPNFVPGGEDYELIDVR